ncbi:unnamed protein product [Boreogadus saida]
MWTPTPLRLASLTRFAPRRLTGDPGMCCSTSFSSRRWNRLKPECLRGVAGAGPGRRLCACLRGVSCRLRLPLSPAAVQEVVREEGGFGKVEDEPIGAEED